MKRFFSVLTLMLMVMFTVPEADAKKFGGGKSFGKSFKTAPAPAKSSNTSTLNKQTDPGKSSMKKGLLGGLFGGLLAGGLLAAMFGGGFEGFQFLDFILIAVVAFVLFKVYKNMMAKKAAVNQGGQPFATAGPAQKGYFHEQSPAPMHGGGFGQPVTTGSDVPFNFAPDFDMPAFLHGAREHYRILQEAWNQNKLATIQEYVTPELYNELAKERASIGGEQYTEVMYVDAEVVRADYNGERAEISLQFSGRYQDRHENVEAEITDIWHLSRSLTTPNAPWLIVGIEA